MTHGEFFGGLVVDDWEGYEQGYSTSTGSASAADDVLLLAQLSELPVVK